MGNEDVVLTSIQNNIGTLTLNRPGKRNAMDHILIEELTSAFEQFREDPKVRAIILTANGEHFCAGADIKWMQTVAQTNFAENKNDAMLLANLLYEIYTCTKPVIVLAHGATLGGGLGLVAACDIAIAATTATFAFSEVKIGITPSVISPYIISAIGERETRYYFLTGEKFDAQKGQRIGLVHDIVDPNALNESGIAMAEIILKNSPNALTAAKELIHDVSIKKISPELSEFTAEHLAKIRTTSDAKEGLLSFLEKRPARWNKI